MNYLQAIILGIVQGLTEFFPVSSSGHLELFQLFFGLENPKNFIFFDLICHLGTLLAIFVAFKEEIKRILFQDKAAIKAIMIALLPLFPLLLILKEVKALFDKPELLGFTFMITSVLLFISMRFKEKQKETAPKRQFSYKAPLFIGLFQAFAILPGVSRSGSTIAAAKMVGWTAEEAIRFSFLLAIPTILGGALVETLSLVKEGTLLTAGYSMAGPCLAGFITSFVVGLFALKTLITLGLRAIHFFAWYCLLLSCFCLLYFL
ncbi:undecaprenyl-diphosphate phosphatase [Estrella lausannensis]|uniref:Undecaprenyl-diphosphatase n=1 Tax=Estrella lausannensis TaxID=483423 RepID=A0A0H5DPP2_9BACT|nr:undecaprenyl-diphosphate phosphatase [Estrella lausannensis]CRX38546.1 putative undecaprenyl-diphosphatase [Estrella lausannensis]